MVVMRPAGLLSRQYLRFAVSFVFMKWSVVMEYVAQSTDIVPAQRFRMAFYTH